MACFDDRSEYATGRSPILENKSSRISICGHRDDDDFYFAGAWVWISNSCNYCDSIDGSADTIDVSGKVYSFRRKGSMGCLCDQ